MKNKKAIIILSILVLVAILVVVGMKMLSSSKGDNSEYQLILTANYGGYGEAGFDLGSGTQTRTYSIYDGDTFYEPNMGGLWKKDGKKEEYDQKTFKIVHLKEDYAEVKIENQKTIIRYNQEYDVPSNYTIIDGTNYTYKVDILKPEYKINN